MHRNNIVQNFITIFSNKKQNQNLFTYIHFTKFIQPLKYIKSRMFYNIQIQLFDKCSVSHINITPIIHTHIIHLIIDVASHVKNILLLLLQIILFNLNIQCSFNHK
jgi:hypothetical protein